jgi:hypothetical protein
MTNTQYSIPAEVVTPTAVQLTPLARAQAAGDRAYARALARGAGEAEQADAYHRAFASKAWLSNALPPCACAFCAFLREEEDAGE